MSAFVNRDTRILLTACAVFERQGCKRSSLIEFLQRERSHVTIWLLAARLCELWHDDWETWITADWSDWGWPRYLVSVEGPLYFGGKDSDEAVLTTYLSAATERLVPTAEYTLTAMLSAPMTRGGAYEQRDNRARRRVSLYR